MSSLKPCPWCMVADGLTVRDDSIGRCRARSFWVHCSYCDARGPELYSHDTAAEQWNKWQDETTNGTETE